MNKNLLDEYAEIREEVKILKERIERKKEQLAKIRSEGTVIDSVKGGYGGIQRFKIEGVPLGTLTLVQDQLERQEFILKCRCNKLIEQETEVERFISEMPTSELRKIATLKYIDGRSWHDVAKKMGSGRTETGVRLLLARYCNKVWSNSEYDEDIEEDKNFR